MNETLEQEFDRIIKIRKEQASELPSLFTTLVVAFILLPIWLLLGRKG